MTVKRVCEGTSSLLLALTVLTVGAMSQQRTGAPALPQPATGSRAALSPDEPSPFHITGKVINSLSKAPVGRAEITVSPMGARRSNGRFGGRAGGQASAATTDADGRFSVEVPSAGGWSLSVAAHGYHSQAFEEHGAFSTAVILTETNPKHDVLFLLPPAAAIEGYVLDEAGEAARGAQVTLSFIPPMSPDSDAADQRPRRQPRGSQRTDDRGYYKFPGLLPGSYEVRVQAQPWYATNGSGGFRGGTGLVGGGIGAAAGSFTYASPIAIGSGSSAPDPLDVVYPVVWYPGVTDFMAATPIALGGGETKEADFRLLPLPGFHLRLSGNGSALSVDNDGRVVAGNALRNGAYLSQVLPDGTEAGVQTAVRIDPNGETEFSGLAPGAYVVHRQGESEAGSATTIRIAENSARIVDASQATPGVPVTVKIDAEADKPSLQISFREVENGRVSSLREKRDSRMRGQQRGRNTEAAPLREEETQERTISLQPGRYEVTLYGINDLHLASIEAKGATATGRTVTIAGGAPVLSLHVATGRASVMGFVRSHGRPMEGAMVLLVPATLGDPAGLNVTRRDQSNTDGSFDIAAVLPGAYILVAIDHGWEVNWSDPATLRRLLMRGVPLDLSNGGERKETVEAQSP